MAQAIVALDSARTYLNDVQKQMWKDEVLLPHLKEAYRDLLQVLWLNGIPVIRERTDNPIVITAGVLTVPLPTDLIEPIWLKERAAGSSEAWLDMVETDFEPDRLKDIMLRYWAWREEQIQLLGATTNREISLRYWKLLAEPVLTTDPLRFIFAEVFLGPQTAGYAAGSVGNTTLAGELLYAGDKNVGIAGSKLDRIIRSNIKGQQNLPARRIPYRRFARSRLLL